MGNKPQSDFKIKVVPHKKVLAQPAAANTEKLDNNTINQISKMSMENISQLQSYNNRRMARQAEKPSNPEEGLQTI